jgi:hypothetical protein
MVEHSTLKQKIYGSNPATGENEKKCFFVTRVRPFETRATELSSDELSKEELLRGVDNCFRVSSHHQKRSQRQTKVVNLYLHRSSVENIINVRTDRHKGKLIDEWTDR